MAPKIHTGSRSVLEKNKLHVAFAQSAYIRYAVKDDKDGIEKMRFQTKNEIQEHCMPPSHSEAALQREHADAARTSRNENFNVLSSQKLNIKRKKTRMVTTSRESQCLSLYKMYAQLSFLFEIILIEGSSHKLRRPTQLSSNLLNDQDIACHSIECIDVFDSFWFHAIPGFETAFSLDLPNFVSESACTIPLN